MEKILLILAFCSAIFGNITCDTLYLLQDAGETTAPVEAVQNAEENHPSYLILAGGASTVFLKYHPELEAKTLTFENLGIDKKIDRHWKRDGVLSQKSIQFILEKLQPRKVISGVAYEMHGQLLKAFETQGARTYSYWDNINLEGSDPYFKTAKKVASCAQTLLVPSYTFLKNYPDAQVVEQPALESIPSPMPIPNQSITFKHPLIVWIGGYVDEYNESLSQLLQKAHLFSNVQIVMTYHPRIEGKIEKEMLVQYPNKHVSLPTVGFQAAIGEKKVFYFTPPTQSYTNLLIQHQIAHQISSVEELRSTIDDKQKTRAADILEALQVPKGSADHLYRILHVQ